MIPMVDLKRQYLALKPEIDAAIQDVLTSTQFILGPQVSGLEADVSRYLGVPHSLGVASGTDALLLALRAAGIGPGDEVITTPFTFIATAEVVALLHAVPVFADIDPATFNIDPRKIREKITKKTRAVIPVHLFGHPADMDPIMDLAREFDLRVIEDCAQAFGAEYKGRKVGTIGDFGCFSFFPSKNLAGYGDGGMISTSNEDFFHKIKLLRNHGSAVRYYHEVVGYNSRLDELQAAVIRVKLKRIDEFNKGRREAARLYKKHISSDAVVLPGEAGGCLHVYHQFTVRSPQRDMIMKTLEGRGIASAVYYPVPLHLQEAFAGLHKESLAAAEEVSAEVLSLPMFPEISEEEILRVSEAVNDSCP
jgi:dTDP-4-amino-4,6-dideoxygalactose transaminase